MKKIFKTFIVLNTVLTLVALFLLMIAGCEQADNIIQSAQNVTPVAADFTIIGLTATADGSPKIVSIKPKNGKSQGAITVYYEGTSGNVYPKSVIAPFAAGKYAVTFDVEAAEGFNAANGLKAGTLNISVKTSGGNESEDDDNSDDDYENEKSEEENNHEDAVYTEEIDEPLNLVDFEEKAWTGTGAGSYKNRKVIFKGYEWSVSGVTTMNASDHFIGSRGIRFRGTEKDDANNINHLELLNFLNEGIESISFDYASYGSNKGGTIILSCKKEEGNWEEAGRISDIPSWSNAGSQMLNAVFEVNITEKVRFKIEKVNGKSSTSVNIDNIVITY